jgi:hypothetical protein
MARTVKLPDADALGGLPTISVPTGLPRMDDMGAVGRGIKNIGEGLSSFSLALNAFMKEGEGLRNAEAETDWSIEENRIKNETSRTVDYTKVPDTYRSTAYEALERTKKRMSPQEAAKFDARARLKIETTYQSLGNDAFKKLGEEKDTELQGRLSTLQKEGTEDQNVRDDKINESLRLIEEHGKLFKRPKRVTDKLRKEYIDNTWKTWKKMDILKDPEGELERLKQFIPGPEDEPEAEQRGPFDRTEFRSEINSNPALRERVRDILYGEVGGGASREKKLIQLETIFNRAAARGHGIEKATRNADLQKDGYYPQTTFDNGSKIGPNRQAEFDELLEEVLSGSDKSTELLGFPATGNASQGVASRGVSSGRYQQYASLDGTHGTPGVETYVSGHGSDNVERLSSYRRKVEETAEQKLARGTMVSPDGKTIVRPKTLLELHKYAETAVKDRARIAKEEEAARKAWQKEQVGIAKDEYVKRYLQGGDNMPTLTEIAEDKRFDGDGDARKAIADWVQKPRTEGDGPLYVDTWKAIGKTIKTEEQLAELVDKDLLTPAGYDKLKPRLKDVMDTSEDKKVLERFFKDTEERFKTAKDDPTGTTKDPRGTENFLPFWVRTRKQAEDALKKGVPVDQLVDPKSEHYLGKTVDTYRRTTSEIYGTMAPGGIAAPPAATPLSGPKPKREYDLTKKEDIAAAYKDKAISREEAEKRLIENGHAPAKTQAPSVPVSR